MKNSDIREFIKHLSYRVDNIERDILDTQRCVEHSQRSLMSIKSIINRLASDVHLDEIEETKISYQNFANNKVDVVYTTKYGEEKIPDVPVHPFTEVSADDVFGRLGEVKEALSPANDTIAIAMGSPTLEEKAKAFQKCCGKCFKKTIQ